MCNLGHVNQCIKFNTKFTLILETEINKLFKTSAQNENHLVNVDAEIIITSAPYIQYEQIQLDSTFRAYLENTIISQTYLRTGIQKTPFQRTFEINVRSQSHVVDFRGANKLFSFVSISLVYDESDQHRTVYDSYNNELASTKIKSLLLENTAKSYSSLNNVKFDLDDKDDLYLLYVQFVA